jgi:ABC-2 type transport system permease protein
LRAEPDQATDMRFQFQNVTFLLNTIDWLTGETEFIDVRKHEPNFASLKMIDAVKEEASTEVRAQVKVFQDEKDAAVRDAEEKMQLALKSVQDDIAKLQKENEDGRVSQAALQEKVMQFQIKQESLQRLVDVKKQSTERELERNTREIQRQADQRVTAIQNQVKAFAVALPCIPPLIIGVVVFASRRLRERENISKSRLK